MSIIFIYLYTTIVVVVHLPLPPLIFLSKPSQTLRMATWAWFCLKPLSHLLDLCKLFYNKYGCSISLTWHDTTLHKLISFNSFPFHANSIRSTLAQAIFWFASYKCVIIWTKTLVLTPRSLKHQSAEFACENEQLYMYLSFQELTHPTWLPEAVFMHIIWSGVSVKVWFGVHWPLCVEAVLYLYHGQWYGLGKKGPIMPS